MQLKLLQINNFRQFFGEHSLDLSHSHSKNIVVIHGDNGSGKTSILNAFKWAFYDEVDFDTGSKHLANDIALTEAQEGDEVPVNVLVSFEHEGRTYYIERSKLYFKRNNFFVEKGPSVVKVSYIGKDNTLIVDENPSATINFILPSNLQPYFFFNGERIEKLSYASHADDIKNAIKNIMGLTIIERSIAHLDGGVKRELSRDKSEVKPNEIAKQDDIILGIDQTIATKREHLKTIELNIVEAEKHIEDLNKYLKSVEKVSVLQEEREKNDGLIKKGEEEKIQQLARQRDLISEKGFLPLSKRVFELAKQKLSEAKSQGKLPAKIRGQLVDDLISTGLCICNRPILPNSNEALSLLALKNDYSDQDLEIEFFELSANVGFAPAAGSAFYDQLQEIRASCKSIDSDLQSLLNRSDFISTELADIAIDDVSTAEESRKHYLKKLSFNTSERGALLHVISQLESKRYDEMDKLKNLQAASGKIFASHQRLESASKIKEKFEQLLDFRIQEVRNKLSKEVNDIFSKIIKKNFTAKISDDFALEIYKSLPNGENLLVVEKSTGENQICSLSFIASIINDAKTAYQQGNNNFYRGGIFPIVMDSPFGALDEDYRRLIAKYIPELADQVVILVSGTQWRSEVQEECSGRLASAFRLVISTHTNGMPLTSIVKEEI